MFDLTKLGFSAFQKDHAIRAYNAEYRLARSWALSVNPLEAIIVLAILSDVKIIKNYPIVTVTVDNTTILHCQFFTEIG